MTIEMIREYFVEKGEEEKNKMICKLFVIYVISMSFLKLA